MSDSNALLTLLNREADLWLSHKPQVTKVSIISNWSLATPDLLKKVSPSLFDYVLSLMTRSQRHDKQDSIKIHAKSRNLLILMLLPPLLPLLLLLLLLLSRLLLACLSDNLHANESAHKYQVRASLTCAYLCPNVIVLSCSSYTTRHRVNPLELPVLCLFSYSPNAKV